VVAPVFTDEELESLRRFPEIGREELFRFFTLPPAGVGRRPGRIICGWRRSIWGGRAPTTLELKELDEFLLARAMEHDSPTLLYRPVIHSTGRNGPFVSSGTVGLLKQFASLAATRER
jgi:hypothetical protein